MIYLDNSATTKPCAACVETMQHLLLRAWGNPSSVHQLGIDAERCLRAARGQVAKALGAEEGRVFFTSGGTEADNWAIFGTAERLCKRGRHIVTTAVEHHAVLHPMQKLEARGFEVTYLQPDETGCVSAGQLEAVLRPDTILVSVMMVNNETGAVMPIRDMIRVTRRKSPLALFHTDAVQGFFKLPFQAKTLGADLISISGHKIHAAKGVGALYVRPGLPLPPLILGGGQEQNFRSGTENLPGICGFGAACAAQLPTLTQDIANMTALRDACREKLAQVPGLVLIGKQDAPHIVNLALPHLRSQGIINCLQDRDIYVSAGSACSRGHRSHVLEAMHLPPAVIDGSIRVSFSAENTEEDVDALVQALLTAKQTLKG
ncbi:MAG: cysteine desulfurase [Clostridiales bacterium]|nr:cysteine desulfurase [Clostridiales bacterium]